MNIIDQVTGAWKVFCRPPRQSYSIFDLGAPIFQTKDYKCKRHDFKVKNNRGFNLECSYYEPIGNKSPDCVIYLHCFNGSRIESIKFAEPVIARGCAFCCFDFSGSGLSEGEYVSLGYYEQDDVQVIIAHLKKDKNVQQIALWGRSMGAVTALLYSQKFNNEVHGLAIDSAFTSMWEAGVEIADKKVSLPTFIIKGMLEYVRRQIKTNAGYDMDDVNTIQNISKCLIPVLFIVSKEDKLVSYQNTIQLFEKYSNTAKKDILYVKGDHNECRNWDDVLKIADFLTNTIRQEIKSGSPTNHLIQADSSNYNTPNPRDEQKQQNIIKLIQYQQQQELKARQNNVSSPQNRQQHINLNGSKSPTGSITSESPANQLYKTQAIHSHSYHTSQVIHKNSTVTHHYILHNQGSNKNTPKQDTYSKDSVIEQNHDANIKKHLHQYSTSNITSEHYNKQMANASEERNIPPIDSKDIENNPFIQSLLQDLIQKNYTETSNKQINQNQMQTQQSQYNSIQQSPQVYKEQKNETFSTKLNDFQHKQEVVLQNGIQNLQKQLQVQVKDQNQQNQVYPNSYDKPLLNQNLDQNKTVSNSQNSRTLDDINNNSAQSNRKMNDNSPSSNLDMKASYIPDEIHEIDFPRANDFRTKAKINNYPFQMQPSGGSTFQAQGQNFRQSPTGQDEQKRKASLCPENIINSTQIPINSDYIFQEKLNNKNFSQMNTPNYYTTNNSPQFFAEKSAYSPNINQTTQSGNKNVSSVLLEESIKAPQSNNYNQQYSTESQKQQAQNLQNIKEKDQQKEEDDENNDHNCPQNTTLTLNLKQYF